MKKFLIVLVIFFLDRTSKMYLINLQATGTDVDFYIFSFLNFILVWNTGISFGLMSLEPNVFYHALSAFILLINLVLIYFLIKLKNFQSIIIALILGGSLGNLFDRIYYYAVPDFIDLHIGQFHWFTFNVADIFITAGIIVLLLIEFFEKKEGKKINAKQN